MAVSKTTSAPQPLQQPHPPIWVAARDPNSHEFAVQNGCNVQVTPLHLGDEEVENSWDISMQLVKSSVMYRVRVCCSAIPMWQIGEEDAQLAADEINTFYNYFGAWFKMSVKLIKV